MSRQSILNLFTALLLVSPLAVSEPPLEQEQEWFAVMLNGSKMGHMRADRAVFEDRVETSTLTSLKIERSGFAMEVSFEETTKETRDGKPLGFSSIQKTSGSAMEIHGTIAADGSARVVTQTAGKSNEQSFIWPQDALLSEGLRLLTLQQGIKPGAHFRAKAFVPSSLSAIDVAMTVKEQEMVDLFGRELRLHRVEQSMLLSGVDTTSVAYITDDHSLKKMTMQMMGMDLEMIACPQACALSPNEPTDFFAATIATAPQRIQVSALRDGVSYEIRARSGDGLYFPNSAEQQLSRQDDSFTLTVAPSSFATDEKIGYDGSDPEVLAALEPTSWIQSDAPELAALAKQAAIGADSTHTAMAKLERFVSSYVSDKNLSVGYASAFEVSQTRSGDCTEHALLLAGLGRALGIPTRVATGMAYVENWLGTQNAFVPHAWTQAFVGGKWVSYDAALNGFDAGHIALSYGDGDPWKFYEAANTIGNFDIENVGYLATD